MIYGSSKACGRYTACTLYLVPLWLVQCAFPGGCFHTPFSNTAICDVVSKGLTVPPWPLCDPGQCLEDREALTPYGNSTLAKNEGHSCALEALISFYIIVPATATDDRVSEGLEDLQHCIPNAVSA